MKKKNERKLFDRKELIYLKKILEVKTIKEIDTAILKDLKERLKSLKDNRCKGKIIYKFWDVLMFVILASFADNNTWEEIYDFVVDNQKWFKSFLQMTGGIPKPITIERIVGMIDSQELNAILLDFFKSIVPPENVSTKMINADGRVNNGSKRKLGLSNDEVPPLNCLNVYSNELRYCIDTIEIDSKSNEIPTIENYLKGTNLTGVIVTWDALNTQKENVKAVISAKGDYTVPIKANHSLFYNELEQYFDDKRTDEIKAGNTQSAYLKYTEKSHSQVIIYELYQTSDVKWYEGIKEWEKLHTFGMVKKTIIKRILEKNTRKNAKTEKIVKEITTVEKRYYISSRQVDILEFNEVTRGHWGVENKIHWHLDYTFAQDKNTTKNKNALLNLEIIHKFVLGVLERTKKRYNMSLVRIRKHLERDFERFIPEFLCCARLG